MKKYYKLFLILFLILIFAVFLFVTDSENKKALSVLMSPADNFTVIIDPGHGGIDGGTSAEDGTLEKDINLNISLKVRDFLSILGVNTVITREEDISIHDNGINTIRQQKISDIKNRLKIVENAENPVYVSIHQNHFSKSQYHGTQVFYSPNNSYSEVLAKSLQEQIVSSLQPDNSRQIKKSGTEIYLLYHAQCPAVMVECGFLSNQNETELLKNENYQKKLAIAISSGIISFMSNSSEVL